MIPTIHAIAAILNHTLGRRACWLLVMVCLLLHADRASAQVKTFVTLQGVQKLGPIEPDEAGNFHFPDVALRRNAVNTITVTAKREDGSELSQDIKITQVALDQVVVSQITSTPLSPAEIEQLVRDGVIDLDDPANFNVSRFAIVLTIKGKSTPITVPIVTPKVENEIGFESVSVPQADGSGSGNVSDTEIIVFEQPVAGVPGQIIPRIPGVIIIEGRIKSLKEFYSVRLLLMNTSGIFTLSDVTAQTEFPDGGLSNTLPSSGLVNFGNILPGDIGMPGQAEREFIIRGDKIGVRPVRVNFGGKLTGPGIPEDEPIPFNGSALTSVEVKGPPSFRVEVVHPDSVTAYEPYDLVIKITNTGDSPALYSSLDLDVGADATFVEVIPDTSGGFDYEEIDGPLTRQLGHLFPGNTISQQYKVLPFSTGEISSCMGVSDQNIALQVQVGAIGCLVGHYPPDRGDSDGLPTVNVLPFPDAMGIGVDSPVVAFFSEKINTSSISLGDGGTFQVRNEAGEILPGEIRFTELFDATVAVWQFKDNITNRLPGNETIRVQLTQTIHDLDGNGLFNLWQSEFTTTDPANDQTPPSLTMAVDPPVNPNLVIPGQRVTVNAYAADQGTGVRGIELRIKRANSTDTLKLIDQKSVFPGIAPPFYFTVSTRDLIPGETYQLYATAFDNSGNLQDATLPITLAASADPPTIELPADPAQPVPQGINIPLKPVSLSLIGQKVSYFLDGNPLAFAELTLEPWSTAIKTAPLAPGPHYVAAVVEDSLGRQAGDFFEFEIVPNDAKPEVRFSSSLDGTVFPLGSPIAMRAIVTSTVDLRSVRYFLNAPNGTLLYEGQDSFTLNSSELGVGTYTIFALATNAIGNSNDPLAPGSSVAFTIASPGSGNPPLPAPSVDQVGVPNAGISVVSGHSLPGARIEIRNLNLGLASAGNAASDGSFSISVDAASGHVLQVTATDFTQSAEPSAVTQVIVPAAQSVTALSVSPNPIQFTQPGQYVDLQVTGQLEGGGSSDLTQQATFVALQSGIVGVSAAGRVAPQNNGSTAIRVTAAGRTLDVPVTVNIVRLTGLQVTPSSVDFVALDETRALQVLGAYSNGSTGPVGTPVQFYSANTQIATVNAAGVIRARGDGLTYITVSTAGLPPVLVPVDVDIATAPVPTVEILTPADGGFVEPGATFTVQVRGTDSAGTLQQLKLEATGAAQSVEAIQIIPVKDTATVSFSITVRANAVPGDSLRLEATATNASGRVSLAGIHTLQVVDQTPPVVTILAPAPGTPYNFGDTIAIQVRAVDNVAVQSLRFTAQGSFAASETFTVDPTLPQATHTFTLPVPFGLTNPELTLTGSSVDSSGNVGQSIAVKVEMTDADITPPATEVTAASNPGSTVANLISYQITDGLDDIDHVLLYVRRNGRGTFNRYTTEANTIGEFVPSGASGTIAFDSTRQGGDGTYEFYTIGVDRAGNAEPSALAQHGAADASATFAAGTFVRMISADAVIDHALFDNQNLRIDGARVTVVGHHEFHNVELVNGAVLTHYETTATSAFNLSMACWTLTIDATSRIDVNGRGYLGGINFDQAGTTIGNVAGASRGAGGSYGGLGGSYNSNPPNPVYGDLTNPTDIGSGGGAWDNYDGGDGGGLVRLTALNVIVDGAINAKGGVSGGSAAGHGSGGGIRLETATLSGTGSVSADGGTASSGVNGGGGRIAIYHTDLSTFATSSLTARGGQSQYGTPGANGSVYLQSLQEPNGALIIEGQGPGTPFTSLPIPSGHTFDSITLRNNAHVVTDDPIVVLGTLKLEGNSVLTHSVANTNGLQITADRVVIEAGSSIDLTGRGYRGGVNFNESGETLLGARRIPRGTGGSHGGMGASYESRIADQVFCNLYAPSVLGAGGGAWDNYDGGQGGGLLLMQVAGTLQLDGALLAQGGLSAGSAAGNGAGGSIQIHASRLTGSGRMAADGGGVGSGVAGGGGRVALFVDFIEPDSSFVKPGSHGSQLANVTAYAGRGQYDTLPASAGTVYVKLPSQSHGDLYIDDHRLNGLGEPNATALRQTELLPLGPCAVQAVAGSTVTLQNSVTLVPNGLKGLLFNPNVAQSQLFVVLANSENSLTLQTPNANGVALASVAVPGATCALDWRFGRVVLRNGGHLALSDPAYIDTALELEGYALLTHPDATLTYLPKLQLEADEVWIDASSRIDVSAKGYLGGKNFDQAGQTAAGQSASSRGTGGSHGGYGSTYTGTLAGSPFDSIIDPADYGAGGGAWDNYDGGDGGGVIHIVARLLENQGLIQANGQAADSAAGCGAGGSINLLLATLQGQGIIRAQGGVQTNAGVAGGAGRIGIRYSAEITLPEDHIELAGLQRTYGARSGQGTLFIKRPGQSHGDLIIDGIGQAPAQDLTFLPGGLQFDNVVLRRGARLTADEGVAVLHALNLTSNSQMTHSQGVVGGLQIDAATVLIDATSALNADGRGYRGGVNFDQPGSTLLGAAGAERGTAGSYGGYGGGYQSSSQNLVYGDALWPVMLGAGGGAWDNNDGGNGGGRITLRVTAQLQLEGSISVNGVVSQGSVAGNGAGGSVLIESPSLNGQGWIRANGGPVSGSGGVGGGGGRIAVYAPILGGSFASGTQMTAFGGQGSFDTTRASAGTVYVESAAQGGWLLVKDHQTNATASRATSLVPLGPGALQQVAGNIATIETTIPVVPQGLVGLRFNPNLSQYESFAILANTANTITVQSPNEKGVSFASVAQPGSIYGLDWSFENIRLSDGGYLITGDPLQVGVNLQLTGYSLLSHLDATRSYATVLDVMADSLLIDATSRIDASGRGYLGGKNFDERGTTILPGAGSTYNAGGSYGGLGGAYNNATPNALYGSAENPIHLGSGGGAHDNYDGGDGGGAILIAARNVLLDGQIISDGGSGEGSVSGLGSGGSINILANTLSGAGSIRAAGQTVNGVAGGGGRVGILYSDSMTLPAAQITAPGGTGNYGTAAQPGSVYLAPFFSEPGFSDQGGRSQFASFAALRSFRDRVSERRQEALAEARIPLIATTQNGVRDWACYE